MNKTTRLLLCIIKYRFKDGFLAHSILFFMCLSFITATVLLLMPLSASETTFDFFLFFDLSI